MYKAIVKQVHSSKGSIMTVNDLEYDMVSLYLLMYLDEESDE